MSIIRNQELAQRLSGLSIQEQVESAEARRTEARDVSMQEADIPLDSERKVKLGSTTLEFERFGFLENDPMESYVAEGVRENPFQIKVTSKDVLLRMHFQPLTADEREETEGFETLAIVEGISDLLVLLDLHAEGRIPEPKLVFGDTNPTMARFVKKRLGFVVTYTDGLEMTDHDLKDVMIEEREGGGDIPTSGDVYVFGTMEHLIESRDVLEKLLPRLRAKLSRSTQ